MNILHSLRHRLTLVLLALLPLHALLVTSLSKAIVGPGAAPLPLLALWKEAFLGIILLCALLEWIASPGRSRALRVDLLDVCILLTLVAAGISFLFARYWSMTALALGFKYDILPLSAFFILRRVPWSDAFPLSAQRVLLGIGILLSLYGFLTLALPPEFFVWLGYSDLHSLYLPDGPLAAFQFIEGSIVPRIQSTMSGPNQFGLWLLLPLGVLLATLRDRVGCFGCRRSVVSWLLLAFFAAALFFTFSRAAWIGALVMVGFVVSRTFSKRHMAMLVLSTLAMAIIGATLWPGIVIRSVSSAGHWQRPLQALQILRDHPFGLGLGSAGPASNRTSDTCVELPAGSDASWAADRPALCVFVGGMQVQPLDRECSCPLLTENWYLQWAVEMGWPGLLLSLLLPALILSRAWRQRRWNGAHLAYLGLSTAGLFLHSFEESAVAYTVWVMLASVVSSIQKTSSSSSLGSGTLSS